MFSIPFKISPSDAECRPHVSCRPKKFAETTLIGCPGSGIFTFQAELQLLRFSSLVWIGYAAYSFLHPLTFTGRKFLSERLNVSAVTRLSECSWHHGCATEQLLFALSPLPCLPFHHVSSGKILSTAIQEDFSS